VRRSIDAGAIGIRIFAIGEMHGGQILVLASQIAKTNSFYVAIRDFTGALSRRSARGR